MISAIACEKAGVIQDGGLVVLGDQSPNNESDVLRVVSEIAFQRRATLVRSKPVLCIIRGPNSPPHTSPINSFFFSQHSLSQVDHRSTLPARPSWLVILLSVGMHV